MKTLNLELYKKMYLIRRSETSICEHYHEDEMKTPVHLSIGEEAIAAGVCSALCPDDHIFGTYRSHGIYLAKTGDTDDFFAELYGKETGLAKGLCGSMHLSAPQSGFLGTSAIVASVIPVAAGAAYANKMIGNGKVAAVFFGDGAIDEGVFWESLNVSSLMKLPLLFVCEDNGFAVHTPASARHGYKSILNIVSQFDCNIVSNETTDAEKIYNSAKSAIKLIKESQRPCFLYLRYYRYLEHVGIGNDFDAGYRSKEEFDRWYKLDPVKIQRDKLLKLGYCEDEIQDEEKKIDRQIELSIRQAKDAPDPEYSELYRELYS